MAAQQDGLCQLRGAPLAGHGASPIVVPECRGNGPSLEEHLPPTHIGLGNRQRVPLAQAPRRLSCVLRGHLHLLALTLLDQPLAVGSLVPEPWPRDHRLFPEASAACLVP